jgi:hypothetical protein
MPPSPLSEVELGCGFDGGCLKLRGCEQPRAEAIGSKERSDPRRKVGNASKGDQMRSEFFMGKPCEEAGLRRCTKPFAWQRDIF